MNLDEHEFVAQAKYFMRKYEQGVSTKNFIEYFKTFYWGRVEQLALCHRKYLGINTNMFLVNLHR